jgi:hypothetical protein
MTSNDWTVEQRAGREIGLIGVIIGVQTHVRAQEPVHPPHDAKTVHPLSCWRPRQQSRGTPSSTAPVQNPFPLLKPTLSLMAVVRRIALHNTETCCNRAGFRMVLSHISRMRPTGSITWRRIRRI